MPYNVLSQEYKSKIWLMYLRKSRQDDPHETVEEVLAKHEALLQDWAFRELGHTIPEEYIFREIVSGEKISDRRELQKASSGAVFLYGTTLPFSLRSFLSSSLSISSVLDKSLTAFCLSIASS